jgi:hypothetical protein
MHDASLLDQCLTLYYNWRRSGVDFERLTLNLLELYTPLNV